VIPAPEVVRAVTRVLGAEPTSWAYVHAGHTYATKWLVPGAFVKAGSEPSAHAQVVREARVLEALGDVPFTPRVHGFEQEDGWAVLVLEDLGGGQWPPPYPDRGAALFATVDAVARTPPPDFLPRRGPGRPEGTYWSRLAEQPGPLVRLGLVSEDWFGPLDEAESRAILEGDELVHGDLWEGNTCYMPRGVVLVDWADALVGDARIERALAVVSVRAARTEPAAFDFPEAAAYAALCAGANAWSVAHPPDVPGIERLTEVHRRQLRAALGWARELLQLG
jgi:aminoglycoside phosphotransferase (APT) family kinase protein